MSSQILGWEWWTEDEDGKHPNRVHTKDEVPKEAWHGQQRPKHFWAMLVWNYELETPQILEFTQKTIQKEIRELVKDDDWGSPAGDDGYDIVVTRKGEQLNTEYTVMPKPAKKLNGDILEVFKELYCNLDALYDSDDPFENPDNADTPF